MNQEKKYLSGNGKNSVLPPEIKGWNWGAFLMNWIWGIGNKTYIALLVCVPIVNIAMLFVLGAKGNEWAWQNRTWKDIEHFKKTQKKWALYGLLLWLLGVPLLGFSVTGILKGEAYDLSLVAIESNKEVVQLIGSPIEAGFWVSGNIGVSGSSGHASLQYSVSGPEGTAEAYVVAVKEKGKWMLREVIVNSEEQQKKIQVILPEKEDD